MFYINFYFYLFQTNPSHAMFAIELFNVIGNQRHTSRRNDILGKYKGGCLCVCVCLCLIPWIKDKRHLLQESLKKLLDVHMKCESGDKGKYQR